jgi:hypothetical protein
MLFVKDLDPFSEQALPLSYTARKNTSKLLEWSFGVDDVLEKFGEDWFEGEATWRELSVDLMVQLRQPQVACWLRILDKQGIEVTRVAGSEKIVDASPALYSEPAVRPIIVDQPVVGQSIGYTESQNLPDERTRINSTISRSERTSQI